MPVIQASRAASAIGQRLDAQSEAVGQFAHLLSRISALGKSSTRNVSVASQTCLPSHVIVASVIA